MPRVRAVLQRVDGWPRRVLALAFLLVGAVLAFGKPPSAVTDSVPVVVAGHDLAAGSTMTAGDVRIAEWPSTVRPPGALAGRDGVVGRRVAGAVGRGEPITSTRLVGVDLAAGLPPGSVAVPVVLEDASLALAIRPGDVVDLLLTAAADTGVAPTFADVQPVARHAHVLAVLSNAEGDGVAGRVVLLVGVDEATGRRIVTSTRQGVLVPVIIPP